MISKITEKDRVFYESHELFLADLATKAFRQFDRGKFDDAIVDTTWSRIVYGGKLAELRRTGELSRREYNSLVYRTRKTAERLIDEANFLRVGNRDNRVDVHAAGADARVLELYL
jgi:hypothetical protein